MTVQTKKYQKKKPDERRKRQYLSEGRKKQMTRKQHIYVERQWDDIDHLEAGFEAKAFGRRNQR